MVSDPLPAWPHQRSSGPSPLESLLHESLLPGGAAPSRTGRGGTVLLRVVPGGFDAGQAPILLAPRPDESLPGWFCRVAERYDTAPGMILTDLRARPSRATTVAGVLTQLLEDDAAVGRRLGLNPAGLHRWQSWHPATAALAQYLRLYHLTRLPPLLGSSYCPACLAEPDGYWRREWSTPLVTVCLRHHHLLLTCCPTCGQRPFTGRTWMTRPVPTGRCPQRRTSRRGRGRIRPPCPGHLDCATTSSAATNEVTEQQVDAQRLVLGLCARPDAPVPVFGIDTHATVLLHAILELAADAAGAAGAYTRSPVTDEALPDTGLIPPWGITELTTAAAVLSQPTIEAAVDLLDEGGLLPAHGIHAPIGPGYRIKARAHNPLLAALQITRHRRHLTPAAQLMFRTARALPQYPTDLTRVLPRAPGRPHQAAASPPTPAAPHRPQAHPTDLLTLTGRPAAHPSSDPSWWPQLIWPGALPTLARVQSNADDTTRRAAAALAAAKTGSILSWRALSLELGLPTHTGRAAATLTQAARRQHLWPALLAELEELTTALEYRPPPIDYRTRRVVGEDLPLLARALTLAHEDLHGDTTTNHLDTDGHDAAHRDTSHPGPADPIGELVTTVLLPRFWELFTGGDLTLAPTPIARHRDSRDYHRHRAHTRTIDSEHDTLFQRAHAYLTALPAPVVAGPLTWQPP